MTSDAPTGNGIIGDQQAAAQAQDAAAAAARVPTPASTTGGTLALEALKVAATTNDTPEATTARADTYLDWLKENG